MHLIHHVKRNNHRYIKLEKLQRKIQIPLDIRRIDDINDAFWLFIHNILPRNDLFTGIRRHRINARKICYLGVFMTTDHAALPINCHAREVPDMLIRTCQLVKKSCLSRILIAG